MIPRTISNLAKNTMQCLLCNNGKSLPWKPFNSWTKQKAVQSNSVRLYTYSFCRTLQRNEFLKVGTRHFGNSMFQGQQGIKTKINTSNLYPEEKLKVLNPKRPSRKKILSSNKEGTNQAVVAYAVAEEANLESFQKLIEKQDLYRISETPEDMVDVLHLTSKYTVDEEKLLKEFFIFREGSLVCWNVPEWERLEMVKLLLKNNEEPYKLSMVTEEQESMEFAFSKDQSNLVGDKIMIKDMGVELNLDKYAFSNALSQSVKLSIWESVLEKFIDSIEYISEELRKGEKISLSRKEVLRKLGEIFALRHSINLGSDLLDTPDFYWDRDSLELLYQKSCNHLSIGRRTKVMNEKLNHCCELMGLIDTKVNDERHVRLEWMIIILIMVEVAFELTKYVERFIIGTSKDEDT